VGTRRKIPTGGARVSLERCAKLVRPWPVLPLKPYYPARSAFIYEDCLNCREFERRLIRNLGIADDVLYYIKTHGYAALEGHSM